MGSESTAGEDMAQEKKTTGAGRDRGLEERKELGDKAEEEHRKHSKGCFVGRQLGTDEGERQQGELIQGEDSREEGRPCPQFLPAKHEMAWLN
jgi:hypothetical protein